MSRDTLTRADLIFAFGESLRSAEPPTLDQFVAKYQHISVGDLAELVMIDQSARWAQGDRILLEDYLGRFPQLFRAREELISLLGHEYELRQLHGEMPRPQQYYERFPGLQSQLEEHFHLCQALTGDPVAGSEEAPSPPNLLPKFCLIAVHAEGGLGRVWRAYDRELQREVVLKELRPEFAHRSSMRARFLREAQITGQLEHPNIVPVYELLGGDENTQPCYSMRFVRGHTLSEAVRTHFEQGHVRPDPMSRLRLLNAFISVCNAVAYAHSRGIVHRDLKPENVVLGRFGEVFVADWGLAKIKGSADSDSSTIAIEWAPVENTIPGSIMGTPAYMAPEQAEGHNGSMDARTDIYGLGAILYVILTGRPPRAGASRSELLGLVSNQDPVRPRSLNSNVPAALEAVCLKAMARSPDARYASATEIAQEVQRWMVDEPVDAYAEPFLARIRRWLSHYRVIAVIGCFAALAFVVTSLSSRPDRASLEKLLLIESRQDSGERFARLQSLMAEAYFYGLPGPVYDLARAQRACDEALALYRIRTANDCRDAKDPNLDPALSTRLPQELGRLFILGVCLREQLGQKPTFAAAAVRLEQIGLETQAFQDYFKAEQYRFRDELEEAIRCYQQVLGAEPQNFWALTGIGHCYLRTGRADLARIAYQSCIALHPRSPWPWMQRGVAAGMENDAKQAEADFLHALGIDGEFHPARFNLGLLYATRGENRSAIEQFDRFLSNGPNPDVLNARANSWIALGDLAKALEDVESALRLRAGFGPALVTRARIRVQLATGDRAGSLLDTIKDLDNALEEAPKLVEAHLERAKVMELMGNAVEAIDSLGRALEIVRFDVAILRDRARLLIANGKTRQALSDYSVLIRAGKATTDDWRRSGDCHAELELWRDAIADYSEVLDRDPKDLVTLLRRAQCYASQGDLTAAESDCYRVLQAMPDDAAAQALQRRLDSMRAN